MEPKFNLWIEKNGRVVLSQWRVELLETIAAAGSISAAAGKMKVPYRRAWEKVHEIERGLGAKVVSTAIGGPGGGGARLTPAGQRAIEQFHAFASGFESEIARRFRNTFER
jgi:molybdate transport system regulatory protein